jgi:hypothetical protein
MEVIHTFIFNSRDAFKVWITNAWQANLIIYWAKKVHIYCMRCGFTCALLLFLGGQPTF